MKNNLLLLRYLYSSMKSLGLKITKIFSRRDQPLTGSPQNFVIDGHGYLSSYNNFLNKKSFMGAMLTLITFSGCTGMFMAGIPINADKYYPEFIGVKLIPLQPSAIIKNSGGVGIHIPHTKPYGEMVAKIPEGTVIIVEHVVRTYNVENDVTDTIMGKIDVPGYSGLVAVANCDGKEHWTLERCIDLTKYKIL